MKSYLYTLLFIGSLTLNSCSNPGKSNLLIVSVDPQRALLEELVGDKFDIVTVLSPGTNPETFEPGMETRKNLEKAKAYLSTGYLPFEEKIEESTGKDLYFVNTSTGIEPIYGTHDHSHGEIGEGHKHHRDERHADPHVWTSVKNAKIMAQNMYNTVVELDPDNRDFYAQNLSALQHRLDSLDEVYASSLTEPNVRKAFAIWHPSLSYFARDYGLEQISVGYENKEMPASTLKLIIDEAREDSVRVLFFQKEFDSRQAETLNDALGTRMVTINPLDYDWQSQLDTIVSSLLK